MGGLGSGRQREGCAPRDVGVFPILDCNQLARDGVLRRVHVRAKSWHPELFGLTISMAGDGMSLRIKEEFKGGALKQLISLEWTPCSYGSERPWFICPSASCGARVAKLHYVDDLFLCRSCQGLSYASKRRDRTSRAAFRAQRIRRRLGGSGRLTAPLPPRPPHISATTYRRLVDQLQQAEAMFLAGLADLQDRIEAGVSLMEARLIR
jgi:hypothetical protein